MDYFYLLTLLQKKIALHNFLKIKHFSRKKFHNCIIIY